MFGFKKSKTYCFHISNFDEIYEKDVESLQKLEHDSLNFGAFPAKLDTVEGVFCVYIDYKKDPLVENPNFSVEKMSEFIKSIGFNVTSVEEQ